MRILITGATGNVGRAVIDFLIRSNTELSVVPAVRNITRARNSWSDSPQLDFRKFDFENTDTHLEAFEGIEVLFLLRPPQLAEVSKVFKPLLQTAKTCGIRKVVFLSVQGADQNSIIPHHKIEKLIVQLGLEYVFLRPGYFMQNLLTTLYSEIKNKRSISLPAGNAKFNWVDVQDIGEVAATVVQDFSRYSGQALVLTGPENRTFGEVVELMNRVSETSVVYRSVNPIQFYFKKKREGVSSAFILVMIMLHFIPRFQKEPKIHQDIFNVLKRKPATLELFLKREKHCFKPNNESPHTENRARSH